MPFTISHAAAVLPLRKLRLPLAAMMIGSMSPDFAYFLPAGLSRSATHELRGVFTICWPASLALWLLFIHLLERPSIELLPEAWRMRVPRSDRRLTFTSLALASAAVIVGALTHIAWDSFTHAGTPMTRMFPILYERVMAIRGRPIPLFFLLQVLSSVAGLLALAWWALRLRHDPPQANRAQVSGIALTDRVRLAYLLAIVFVSAAAALATFAGHADAHYRDRLFRMLISGMTGGLLAWCGVAAFFAYLLRQGEK